MYVNGRAHMREKYSSLAGRTQGPSHRDLLKEMKVAGKAFQPSAATAAVNVHRAKEHTRAALEHKIALVIGATIWFPYQTAIFGVCA